MALAKHPREVGAGVKVSRFCKAGSVDYRKVVKLKGLTLRSTEGTFGRSFG